MLTSRYLLSLAYLGLISSAAGSYNTIWLTNRSGTAAVGLRASFIPVVALLVDLLVTRQRMSGIDAVGVGLVMLGGSVAVVSAAKVSLRRREPASLGYE